MTALTQTFFAGTTLSDRIAALRSQLSEAAVKRRLYKRTVAELQSLNDRELADLGIARTMIETLAHEEAYGK